MKLYLHARSPQHRKLGLQTMHDGCSVHRMYCTELHLRVCPLQCSEFSPPNPTVHTAAHTHLNLSILRGMGKGENVGLCFVPAKLSSISRVLPAAPHMASTTIEQHADHLGGVTLDGIHVDMSAALVYLCTPGRSWHIQQIDNISLYKLIMSRSLAVGQSPSHTRRPNSCFNLKS